MPLYSGSLHPEISIHWYGPSNAPDVSVAVVPEDVSVKLVVVLRLRRNPTLLLNVVGPVQSTPEGQPPGYGGDKNAFFPATLISTYEVETIE